MIGESKFSDFLLFNLYCSILLTCASVYCIKIGAVMPFNVNRLFSIPRVMPAASIAIEDIKLRGILQEYDIICKDSKCNEAIGMNQAIQFYIEGEVTAFFGPVCDYSAAPVARQTRFWNIPMVSIGTIAEDFLLRRNSVYPMLTRAGPVNLGSLANYFRDVFKYFRWGKVKVLYQQMGQDNITGIIHFCHLAAEVLVNDFKSNFHLDYYRLEEEIHKQNADVFLNELGKSYGGKCCTICSDSQSFFLDARV